MENMDLFAEWESHSSDRLSKERLDAAYRGVRRTIDRPRRRRRALLCACGAFAAVCCLIVAPLVSISIYKGATEDGRKDNLCEVATHYGETRTLVLPDGTSVTLNAGSVLIYPETFDKDMRNVYLTGEAKFDVAHDAQRPFTVNTIDFAIKVHGTVFNINSYPDRHTSSATLCSGSISAELNESGKTVGMVPDQRLTYNRDSGTYELTGVNSREYTAWEVGDVCFNSESIHNIVSVIERRFGVNVYITSGKYDEACITAKFLHGETLEEVMSAVCRLVPGMKYKIENTNVYIK